MSPETATAVVRPPGAPPAADVPVGIALALGAIVVVQSGHALAVVLLERVGVLMSATFRAGFSALILLIATRPAVRGLTWPQWRFILLFGASLVVQSIALYEAISRIPLGVALAIAFLGPLGVAVWRGRRTRDLLCAATALAGVILLVELPGASGGLEAVGVLAACVSAFSWGAYIVCSKHAMAILPGLDGLALSMGVSAVVLVPITLAVGPLDVLEPSYLALGLATALLATALPFSMESLALRRMPVNAFGILMSLEPAVAAFTGFVALGQDLPLPAIAGIALVVIASVTAATGTPRSR